jgi:3-isopropylmalate/(R)-2-methylmalate dehydratase small subunit
MGAGLRAVISTDFADIFRNNALKNGLIPVIVDEETKQQLISLAQEDLSVEVTINLADQTVQLPDGRKVTFPIDSFSKYCLLNGVDQLGFLLGLEGEVVEYESNNKQRIATTAL